MSSCVCQDEMSTLHLLLSDQLHDFEDYVTVGMRMKGGGGEEKKEKKED